MTNNRLNNKGQLTATANPAQPRRPEILRLATATAFYGGGGNLLRLTTAYELYGGLWRLTAAARGPTDDLTRKVGQTDLVFGIQ